MRGLPGPTRSRVTSRGSSWSILVLALILPGCWDGPSPLGLSDLGEVSEVAVIGARAAPDFAESGRLSLVVIPLHEGEVVAPQAIRDVEVHVEGEGPTRGTVTGTRTREPRTDGEIAGAILLDSSGSMSSNDPLRLRVTAGHLFIEELEAARLKKGAPFILGAFDFGAGSTPGRFAYTRVLQDYTPDPEALRQGVAATVASGLTPLFGSAREVIEELGQRFPGGSHRRVMLLLSDGLHNQGFGETLNRVVDAAVDNDVVILSVSLGARADEQSLARMAQASGGSSRKVEEAAGLVQVLGLQAVPLTQSHFEATVRLTPVPPPGTALPLRVDVNTGFRPVSTRLVFTAP